MDLAFAGFLESMDSMIPYDPNALSASWFLTWRSHLCTAHMNPEQQEGYCRAACIAYAQHLMYAALERFNG